MNTRKTFFFIFVFLLCGGIIIGGVIGGVVLIGEKNENKDEKNYQNQEVSPLQEDLLLNIPENLSEEEKEQMRVEMEEIKREQEKREAENREPLAKIDNEYRGTFEVSGYIERKNIPCEPQGMCQGEYEYITFIAKDASTKQGESYLEEKNFSLGIGCYIESQKGIFSQNYSDGGTAENHISGELLEKLLKSSSSDLVTLKLTKPSLHWEGSRPACYSDYRNIQ
jgi:hypothetical protein